MQYVESSSGQACDGRLIWDSRQEQVQVVLEKGEVSGILILEMNRNHVKEVYTMNS